MLRLLVGADRESRPKSPLYVYKKFFRVYSRLGDTLLYARYFFYTICGLLLPGYRSLLTNNLNIAQPFDYSTFLCYNNMSLTYNLLIS